MALAALLDGSGVDAATLAAALQSIARAKEVTAPPPEGEGKVYLNKELIYEMRLPTFIKEMTPKRSIIILECGIESQRNLLSNL